MPRQTNFGGGEIAPMSWGRNDRPFFARGLRTMRNFFPARNSGAAVSRPGSVHLGQTRDNTSAVRLIPFVYADDSSFCLEVGLTAAARVYVRFWQDGALLQARYLPIDIVTAGALRVGDTLIGGYGGTARILSISTSLLGHTQVQVGAEAGPAFNFGEPFTTTGGAVGTLLDGVSAGALELNTGAVPSTFDLLKVKYAQTGAVMLLTHPDWPAQELRRLDDVGAQPFWTLQDYVFARPFPFFDPSSAAGGHPVVLNPFPTPDAAHPAREWGYICTLTVQDTLTGRTFETAPWYVVEQWDDNVANAPTSLAFPSQFSVYPDQAVTLKRGGHLEVDGYAGALTEPAQNKNFPNTSYRVLGMNVYRGRDRLFGLVGTTDVATFVDVGAEPDYATPPPRGTHPFRITDVAGATVTERPRAVAFFQDSLLFAGTPRRPAGFWKSATGDYADFDLNELVHTAGESLYFELASRRFEQIINMVSHQKLIVGTKSSVWSVSGAQGGVLDFDSVDARVVDEVGMTELAPLVIDGKVLFARTKGSGVRALVFDGQYGMYDGVDLSGQSEHLFLGDSISALGTAYGKALVDWTYAEDPWGVVWAVRADGLLLSLTLGAEGTYGWARHDGDTNRGVGGIPTSPRHLRVCAVPEGDEDAVYMVVERIINNAPKYFVERMTSRVRRGNAFDDGCLDCSRIVNQPTPSASITGLDHLEGEQVYVCAKGNAPQGPFTVTGGAITLGAAMAPNFQLFRVLLYVGLKFTPELELLDVVSAESRLKKKAVTRVGFELDQSSGILLGQDFDNLTDSRPHTVESGWDAPVPQTSIVEVNPVRHWDTGGRACLRQTLPLPVTVVGAVRELDVGG